LKAVLFDIDGTLIDSVDFHAEAWVRALGHFGIEVGFDEMRGQIGKGGDQLLPLFVPAERLAREQKEIETFRSEMFKRDYLRRIKPFPAVRPLVQRCREAGLTIALASSGHEDEVKVYTEIAGIADLVDVTTTSSDVAHSKPCPDIFQAALEKCAPARAEDVVVIGDTPYDAEAAVRAGIRPIGVLCGGFPEADLRAAGAVAIYRDPADLLARFAESSLAG
jgi:HAD superfamily hydrolase (TIGR01549 family)